MRLQISEPGQSPLPHQHEIAIGIDLGTTHSVVAVLKDGNVQVIEDEGHPLIPSVVALCENQVVAGRDALNHSQRLSSIKRLMGRGGDDSILSQFPNLLTDIHDEIIRLKFGENHITAIEVSAEILKHLKVLAEKSLNEKVKDAVITVPAHFDDAARQATKDAAKLAGLNVLRLVNEPTAAALAYGLDKGAHGIYAVYDWGGGTFDFSLLNLDNGVFQVLATGGDLTLGGDDIDWAILQSLTEQDLDSLSPIELQDALSTIRKSKENLSSREFAGCSFSIGLECVHTELTGIELNGIAKPFIARTLKIAESVLRDAEVKAEDVKGVVLVGGSSRLKLVRSMIASEFGIEPLSDIDPDLVVAMGAAQQAGILTGHGGSLLLDVTPLSLGIETMGGIVEKIIPRNSPIPCEVSQDFTTYVDGQTGISIHVVQGERELAKDCRSLAHFELKGLPVKPAGKVKVKIDFRIDADGILKVKASEMESGKTQEIQVKPSYGLSEDEIRKMLEDSWRKGAQDLEDRFFIESKIQAVHLIEDVEKAIAKDLALLSKQELRSINDGIRLLREAIESHDRHQVDVQKDQLIQLTEDFAQRRIRKALEEV